MRAPVTIGSARFEDLVAIGLHQLISEDTNLQLVEDSVELEELEDVLARRQPNVVLLNFGSLPNAAWVYQLHQSSPDTRIVVLANRPTAAESNQLLSFGATACISKETQGRDIINAIHLASRGMRVLPRSTSAPSDPAERFDYLPEADILTAREATSSASCTALVAAPLRRWSPTMKRFRQRSCDGSRRMRPTRTSSRPAASIASG